MSRTDKFKAAFSKKSTLATRLRTRVTTALRDLEAIRSLAETLPDGPRATTLQTVDRWTDDVMDQVTIGASKPGDAWVAVGEIQKDVTTLLQATANEGSSAQATPDERFSRALRVAVETTLQARAGIRSVSRESEVPGLHQKVEDLLGRIDVLAQARASGGGVATTVQYKAMVTLREEAGALVREVRGVAGLDPEPGTQRALSRAVVDGLRGVPELEAHLGAPDKDARGRTALDEVQGRLAFFDDHHAQDTSVDPQAIVYNKAMRLAAISQVAAERIAAKVNDPFLVPRIGQSLVTEYAPEMKDTLAADEDDDTNAKAAVLLARALVMDDPLTKLMNGRLNPPEAVQRIRDMAEAGGVEPSMMLKLLRQQFEMRVGTQTYTDVVLGEKDQDQDTLGSFVLKDITGELSGKKFRDLVETTTTLSTSGAQEADLPALKDDGSGLKLKSTSEQLHVVVAGDTFGTLAATYLKDATRWQEIADDNKIIVVQGVTQDLKAKGGDDALPVGASLRVPGQSSLLDQLVPYVAAWDEAEDESGYEADDESEEKPPKRLSVKKTDTPDKELKGALKSITPEDLQKGIDQLRTTGQDDPSYIQAPRPGHGQLNGRQYAHLRMLQRADDEERALILAREGKPVADVVTDKIAARYGTDAVTAAKIAKAAAGWIQKVPITITFTGDRLFSDASKDAPTHGTRYKSDVELTRGREKMSDLIGRGTEVGDEQVGTQGGSKTITGWKERGDNYMRWRRDKDHREGRNDELVPEDQQLFGAANPAFEKAKGGSDGGEGQNKVFGTNYYGDAHFLLNDAVRTRCAYIVRSGGALTKTVQRRDLEMLLYDMVTTLDSNAVFLDAMVSMASGSPTVTVPSLNWEVHLYGGFDMTKDAAEIYLSDAVGVDARGRIERFALANHIPCKSIGAKPMGFQAQARQDPKQIVLPDLAD